MGPSMSLRLTHWRNSFLLAGSFLTVFSLASLTWFTQNIPLPSPPPLPPPRATAKVSQGGEGLQAAAAPGESGDDPPSLAELIKRSDSDKYWRHHYEHYYESWLAPYRHMRGMRMVEIGADSGMSMAAWGWYFTDPGAKIYGLAYGVGSSVKDRFSNESRVEILYGDQSDLEVLRGLCQRGPFDIIIDDGSHLPEHVLISFSQLFQCVRPGGVYIVEDLETSYWNKVRKDGTRPKIAGYKINGAGIGEAPPGNAVEKFKQLVEVLMRKQLGYEGLTVLPGDGEICSIEFGMNLLKVQRCTQAQSGEPPMIGIRGEKVVDAGHMESYLERARSTNPKGI